MAKRIMVVEDEAAIADMIAMNLRAAGMEPRVFYDGAEAAESLASDHAYDLALLDIMLPGKDGFALFEDVKPYGIPVIFLTAKDDLRSKITGLQGGAEDYIVKPFEVLELLVRMEKVLNRQPQHAEMIEICGLEIDLSARTVRRGSEEISLKPMEFDLLAVLAKYPNTAVSRDDLLHMVWGVNFLGETRTVDVHIAQLRKKLGLHDAIVTVPKYGYRLEVQRVTP
ncbi:MAG: response regulator transcription factor [Oscillospiraceae bacterium]|nr:response regulator transcription factor [Oscillospiraceae bacterium]